ncbi:hypothetical protein [uncultured Desulfobacter sp.]|uniref:hypothetical protein n=1 Tax=uncultured Desulfobacter sp. TaxID=240139 RepID=UPI0037490E77
MMMDEYNENNKKPLVGAPIRRHHTIPKTFTLPLDVINTLSWFSDKLGIKKSHLVVGSVLNFEKMEEAKFYQYRNIDDLMNAFVETYFPIYGH